MTAIITPAEITAHLESMGAVELRKLGAKMGIKGASKGRKADLVAAIAEIRIAEAEALAAKLAAEAPKTRKGICNVCDKRRVSKNHSGMCEPCYEEGAWENTHSDENHEALIASGVTRSAEENTSIKGCWICHPELNEAQREVRQGRSRAGMVIVAKGSEIHKSNTFKVAAEAAGWNVNVLGSVTTDEDGEEIERFVAIATKGDDTIELAWNGRAYDYPASSANFGGKGRKVRNLKEALRLL